TISRPSRSRATIRGRASRPGAPPTQNSWGCWRTRGKRGFGVLPFFFKDIILVGRESSGVPETVHVSSDVRVYIPIQPPLRSLNVGIAATIAMTEALPQLGRLPSSRKGEG